MNKEKIIQRVRQKMGEPIVKHLTDEDYNKNYDLVEKIMVNTKLNKEFGTEGFEQQPCNSEEDCISPWFRNQEITAYNNISEVRNQKIDKILK